MMHSIMTARTSYSHDTMHYSGLVMSNAHGDDVVIQVELVDRSLNLLGNSYPFVMSWEVSSFQEACLHLPLVVDELGGGPSKCYRFAFEVQISVVRARNWGNC